MKIQNILLSLCQKQRTENMNNNVVAYIIYILITIYIIIWLGKSFHRNGRVFILQLYKGDTTATDTTNNLLLVAYYLFNIGYALLQLRQWEKIFHTEQLIATLSSQIGLLILILAVTHYFNMLLIYFLSKKQFSKK